MPPPPAARGPHPLDEAHEDSSVGHDVLPAAEAPPAEAPAEPDDLDEDPTPSQAADVPGRPGDESATDADSSDADSSDADSSDADCTDADGSPSPDAPTSPVEDDAPARPAAGPAKKTARRSVPSWDDVMFGAKPRD
jgi:hypothetical protein